LKSPELRRLEEKHRRKPLLLPCPSPKSDNHLSAAYIGS
jgi:hypothetical protein